VAQAFQPKLPQTKTSGYNNSGLATPVPKWFLLPLRLGKIPQVLFLKPNPFIEAMIARISERM
jgi:hypothetical protein